MINLLTLNRNFADVSSNNSNVDLASYKSAKYNLIAIKLGGGYGNEWDGDPEFSARWKTAGELGLFRWAYWYWKGGTGLEQATQIDKLIKANGPAKKNDRIVIDWEVQTGTPASMVTEVRQGVTKLQQLGHTILLYSNPGFLNAYGNPQFGIDLWIADYARSIWNPGNYHIAAWQHSGGIQGLGIPPYGAQGIGYCDMSVLTTYGIRKHIL